MMHQQSWKRLCIKAKTQLISNLTHGRREGGGHGLTFYNRHKKVGFFCLALFQSITQCCSMQTGRGWLNQPNTGLPRYLRGLRSSEITTHEYPSSYSSRILVIFPLLSTVFPQFLSAKSTNTKSVNNKDHLYNVVLLYVKVSYKSNVFNFYLLTQTDKFKYDDIL